MCDNAKASCQGLPSPAVTPDVSTVVSVAALCASIDALRAAISALVELVVDDEDEDESLDDVEPKRFKRVNKNAPSLCRAESTAPWSRPPF